MWPDNETSTDFIGFKVHADLIREVVTDPSMLPVTIGIFGDWGGGKTSIMKMLQRSLDPVHFPIGSSERQICESTAVVYVNTWQFEGYDDAKSAILSSVLLQLREHQRFGTKVKDGVRKLLKAVNWGRFVHLSLKNVAVPAAAAFMTGGATAVPAVVAASMALRTTEEKEGGDENVATASGDELWKGLPDEPELDIKAFRQQFEELLAATEIRSLVVLIDDLDRCTPERVVESLEAVKLFLSVDGTAFVIGADRRIVEHAVRSKYTVELSDDIDHLQADQLARDYVEKVVQIPYTLPRLSASEVETYMVLLFCQRFLDDDELAMCLQASENARTANRYGTFGYGGVKAALDREPDSELTDALVLSAAAAPLVADGLKGNPRQVKRFLNALLLRRKLARVARLEESIRTDVLVKLMVLEYVEPDRFEELYKKLGTSDGRVQMLQRLEGTVGNGQDSEDDSPLPQQWTTNWMRRWLSVEPHLAEVDLRDYFWVARDRLGATLAGVTMVPPAVRMVFENLTSGQSPRRLSAVNTSKTLQPDELSILYGLLAQHITTKPGDIASWEPLRVLADASVHGASECLAAILFELPRAKLPAALGVNLVNLHNDREELRETLGPVIDHLRGDPKTMIGKAIQSTERST